MRNPELASLGDWVTYAIRVQPDDHLKALSSYMPRRFLAPMRARKNVETFPEHGRADLPVAQDVRPRASPEYIFPMLDFENIEALPRLPCSAGFPACCDAGFQVGSQRSGYMLTFSLGEKRPSRPFRICSIEEPINTIS